jgi:hypothetical protein
VILTSVEIDCDTCMDRVVDGALSVTQARRLAKGAGVRAYKGEHGEPRHECRHCRACSRLGHEMEGLSTRFAVCKLCGMRRSIQRDPTRVFYSTEGEPHSSEMPKCSKNGGAK